MYFTGKPREFSLVQCRAERSDIPNGFSKTGGNDFTHPDSFGKRFVLNNGLCKGEQGVVNTHAEASQDNPLRVYHID